MFIRLSRQQGLLERRVPIKKIQNPNDDKSPHNCFPQTIRLLVILRKHAVKKVLPFRNT